MTPDRRRGAAPHRPLVQVALPPVGTGQGVQLLPHELTAVSSAQTPPQRWKPPLHDTPQLVPSQVGVPLLGVAHGAQLAAHEATSMSLKHSLPQAW